MEVKKNYYLHICRPLDAGSYGRLPLATAGLLFS